MKDFSLIGQVDGFAGWDLGVREAPLASHPDEDGRQLIIIGLGERFAFMVMTPGAPDGLPEKNRSGGIRHIVQRIVAALHLIG